MSAIIRTNKGAEVKVDEGFAESFQKLGISLWLTAGYPSCKIKRKSVYLHHLVLKPEPGLVCDHINRDKMDCRRSNLRAVDKRQNGWNAKKRADAKTSKYKGVYFASETGCWAASFIHFGKRILIGLHFPTEEAAAFAYNEAIAKHRGELAPLNVIN